MDSMTQEIKALQVAKRIKQCRLSRKLTQKHLADLINVSPQVISNWERNYTNPDYDDIARLSRILHVSADYLLKGDRSSSFVPPQPYHMAGAKFISNYTSLTGPYSRSMPARVTNHTLPVFLASWAWNLPDWQAFLMVDSSLP